MRRATRAALLVVACAAALPLVRRLPSAAAASAAPGPDDTPDGKKLAKPGSKKRSAKPANPSRAAGKKTAAQAEAEAFLGTITGLLKPVATRATLADWASLTDVTPVHTGQRVGADGALAALAGSPLII